MCRTIAIIPTRVRHAHPITVHPRVFNLVLALHFPIFVCIKTCGHGQAFCREHRLFSFGLFAYELIQPRPIGMQTAYGIARTSLLLVFMDANQFLLLGHIMGLGLQRRGLRPQHRTDAPKQSSDG